MIVITLASESKVTQLVLLVVEGNDDDGGGGVDDVESVASVEDRSSVDDDA